MPNQDEWDQYKVKPSGDEWEQYKVAPTKKEMEIPDAVAQAQKVSRTLPPEATDLLSRATRQVPRPPGGGEEAMLATGAPPAVRTMAEMGAGGEAAGLVKGGGLAARLLAKPLLMGAGTAAGSFAGQAASGEIPDPSKALETGALAATAGIILEPAVAAGSALLRPFLQKAAAPATEAALHAGVSKEATELSQLANAEEGLRQSITSAPMAIRKNVFSKIYPTIDEAVDIYAPSKQAMKAGSEQIAHGLPSELHKTVRIGRQIKQLEATVRELASQDRSLASDPMQQAELLDTMQALYDKKQITFRQARNLRSALAQAIAKGQGYKLPAETYQALRSVHDIVDEGMSDAAERAGKLDQFKNADKVYRQFMRDFYDKNAPLKGVLDYRQGMTGKTLRSLIKPSNVNRAQEALGRWGLKDQAEALKKIADMPDPNESIGSMEKLSTSEKGFTQTRLEAAREADAKRVAESKAALQAERSKRLKMLGLTGGAAGTLYEGYRLLNK